MKNIDKINCLMGIILLILIMLCCNLNIEENFSNRKRKRKRRRNRFYKRTGYRRFPYFFDYNFLGSPFNWGNPFGYYNYNWFDYRTCPSGCVANSFSPSGFSCSGNNSITSCRTDYDCSGCNVPLIY